MSVVVAHDYCTQRGGAERVALELLRAFPGSHLVTSVYNPAGTFDDFENFAVRTSVLQSVAAYRRDPRLAFPLLPVAWRGMGPMKADAVVCSSSGWAHAVPVDPSTLKVVYCHNPPRWIHQPGDYFQQFAPPVAAAGRVASRLLRRWDSLAARSADRYVANSTSVALRIRAAYGIEADVVHPPSVLAPDSPQAPIPDVEPGFLLSVGRGRGYKNTDVVVAAMADLPKERLVVVGGYDGMPVGGRVTRLTDVTDAELAWLYANAKAVVSMSFEDFGLTPVEGFTFGTPAVLLKAGGFLDSMVEGATGVFADELSPQALACAVQALPGSADRDAILAHARAFSAEAFARRMRSVVDEALSMEGQGVQA